MVNEDRRELQGDLACVRYCDLIYADDFLYALAQRKAGVVEMAAQRWASFFQIRLKGMGLSMMPVKSENALYIHKK